MTDGFLDAMARAQPWKTRADLEVEHTTRERARFKAGWSDVVALAALGSVARCASHPPARVALPGRPTGVCEACDAWWLEVAYCFSSWGALLRDGTLGHLPVDPVGDAALVVAHRHTTPVVFPGRQLTIF